MIEIGRANYSYKEDDLMISIVALYDLLNNCKPEDRRALEIAITVVEAVWDTYFGEDEIKQ